MNARRRAWPFALALLATLAIAATIVVVPALLLQPFEPQAARDVVLAHALRRASPWATIALLVAGVVLALAWSRRTTSVIAKSLAALLLIPLVGLAWLSRQNHFEWMFHPLPSPAFVEASRATHVDACDKVLVVVVDGEARAYPVRLLANHHVVNDVVAGRPITATY